MSIELTAAQQRAVEDLATTDRPVTRLHGYAGTGKTTVVAIRAIERMVEAGVTVQALAPTGKAARVLRSKGMHNAATIHSYLYQPRQVERDEWRDRWAVFARAVLDADPPRAVRAAVELIDTATHDTDTGHAFDTLAAELVAQRRDEAAELRRAPRWRLAFRESGAITFYEENGWPASDVLVIDEASMVSDRIAADLARTGSRLIYIGDPAQLPPVGAQVALDAMGEPHHLLTEVKRQSGADGAKVLKLATRIRTRPVPEVDTTPRSKLLRLEEYDQILCWKNATRERINLRVREALGRSSATLPEPGDKLVSLKNTRPSTEGARQWLNGEQVTVLGVDLAGLAFGRIRLTVLDDEGVEHGVSVAPEPFEGVDAERQLLDGFNARGPDPIFTFGYGLTVHKAQGSEWDRVLLVDESPNLISVAERFRGRAAALDEARQWLYTGVTRAAKKLHVVSRL